MMLRFYFNKILAKITARRDPGNPLEIVRRWNHEIWDRRNPAIIDQLAHEDYFNHSDQMGKTGFKQMVQGIHGIFSNLTFVPQDQLTQGDKVVVRWTLRGVHSGVFMGIAPTGKEITIQGISIYRLAQSKIVEDWSASDMLPLLRQLGVQLCLSDGNGGFFPLKT